MNCEECGRRMMVINGPKGLLVHCENCYPGLLTIYLKELSKEPENRIKPEEVKPK